MANNRQIGRWIWMANTGLSLALLVISIEVARHPADSEDPRRFIQEAERRAAERAERTAKPPPKPMEYYSPIWSWSNPPVPPPIPPHAPLETLVSVQGVKQDSRDAKHSCAFLTLLRTRESQRKYVGESVENATVTSITGPGTVEFLYFEERVSLTVSHGSPLPHRTGPGGLRSGTRSRATAGSGGIAAVPDFKGLNFQSREDPNAPGHWRVDPREKEFVLGYGDEILRQVEWHPYRTAGGEMSGMAIDRIEENSIVAGRGFRTGDIIRSIDGSEINTFEQARQAMRRTAQEGKSSLVIELERGGRTIMMQFDVR